MSVQQLLCKIGWHRVVKYIDGGGLVTHECKCCSYVKRVWS